VGDANEPSFAKLRRGKVNIEPSFAQIRPPLRSFLLRKAYQGTSNV
jgi:hypothetical protein